MGRAERAVNVGDAVLRTALTAALALALDFFELGLVCAGALGLAVMITWGT
jgi:hypothetical protein